MNPITPLYQAAVQAEHEQRLQKAAEQRLLRLVHTEETTKRTIRGRIGLIVMRAGARLTPDGELAHERRKQAYS